MTGHRDDEQHWDATPPGPEWHRSGPPPGAPAPGGPPPHPPQAGFGVPPAYGAPPAYGPQGWWAPAPAAFPQGPARPPQVTAAAVLGFVSGGFAILWGLVGIVLLAGSDGGSSTWLGVVVGLPAGALLIVGGVRMLARADRWFVVGGAAALAVTVLLQAVVSAASSYGTAFGQAILVVFLLPVPTVAAVLAGLPLVGAWVAARDDVPPPQQQAPPGW